MGQAPDSLRDPSNASNAPRLIDRFRAAIRSRHYSRRTEKTYWFWIRYFIFHNNKRHLRTDARSSLSELDTQLDLSRDLGFVTEQSRSEIDPLLTRIDKMLYALHQLKKSAIKPE